MHLIDDVICDCREARANPDSSHTWCLKSGVSIISPAIIRLVMYKEDATQEYTILNYTQPPEKTIISSIFENFRH